MTPEPRRTRGAFDPDWTIHPGSTLREWREENGLGAKAAATTCGRMDPDVFSAVESGKRKITKTIAAQLEHGTYIPARLWLRLEERFRADLKAGRNVDRMTPDEEYAALTPRERTFFDLMMQAQAERDEMRFDAQVALPEAQERFKRAEAERDRYKAMLIRIKGQKNCPTCDGQGDTCDERPASEGGCW